MQNEGNQLLSEVVVTMFVPKELIDSPMSVPSPGSEKEKFELALEIPDYKTVEDLIMHGIDHFNEVLFHEHKPLRLPEIPELYTLKIAKPNGKPDSDFPDLSDHCQTILSLKYGYFCICFNEAELVEQMKQEYILKTAYYESTTLKKLSAAEMGRIVREES